MKVNQEFIDSVSSLALYNYDREQEDYVKMKACGEDTTHHIFNDIMLILSTISKLNHKEKTI